MIMKTKQGQMIRRGQLGKSPGGANGENCKWGQMGQKLLGGWHCPFCPIAIVRPCDRFQQYFKNTAHLFYSNIILMEYKIYYINKRKIKKCFSENSSLHIRRLVVSDKLYFSIFCIFL